MNYTVELRPKVSKDLKKIDKRDAIRIAERIVALSYNPFPLASTKMVGQDAYRLRVGDYRVLYEVHNHILLVHVLRVGHRKQIYKD